MEALVVDISIPPSSFKPVSYVFVHVSPLYLKHPNKSFFNPIKYILNIFYTHSIYCFINLLFFRFNVQKLYFLQVSIALNRDVPEIVQCVVIALTVSVCVKVVLMARGVSMNCCFPCDVPVNVMATTLRWVANVV